MNIKDSYTRFTIWKNKNISEKQMLLFVCFLIGILTALAAFILKWSIHKIHNALTENFIASNVNYLFLLYPIIGILLARLFVRYIVKDDISHGVTKILYAISQRKSFIKLHNTYTSVIASSITIGFGGSVGAEAPIVLTGSAIGSNLGRLFGIEQRHLMILIGCGAAGAIAGIFKAPIAGLVFVVEVLMLDLTTFTILPLLVTATTAATVSYLTMGSTSVFNYAHAEVFAMQRMPYVILLGVFCGFVSLYFTRCMNWFEDKLKKRTYWQKFAIGGSVLSILIFIFPPLYGEGYETINSLIDGSISNQFILNNSFFFQYRDSNLALVLVLVAILLLKVFATSATNGGGGTGGTFTPSLFTGCLAGVIFASILNHSGLSSYIPFLPESNFALMGMAGVMAGVMHAPLTGTFLIAELTGGYELLLPLLVVSACSFATIKMFEQHSIYSMRLAKRGELLTHEKDKAILTLMEMDSESLIETGFVKINPEMSLGDMVTIIASSNRNFFPVVVKETNEFLGIVAMDNIRNIIFRPELYRKFQVRNFMRPPAAILKTTMTADQIMTLFDKTGVWNLPVVNEENIYQGFVSKSSMLTGYRNVLVDNFSEH